ncbi:MAG: AsmA family protein [Blastocatellia bacterium]|nr:AsmA family protein [Blastocatellia bacterium]
MVISALVLTLLAGLIGWIWSFDVNLYRDQIARQLEQRLGRSVSFGSLQLTLYPRIRLKATDTIIVDDPQFHTGAFVQAQTIQLDIGFWSLLTGHPQVRHIELVEPTVVLIKEKDDRWNWSTLNPLTQEPSETGAPPINITVRDGRVTLINRRQLQPMEKSYTGIQATLNNFSSNTVANFKLAVTLPGQQQGQLSMEGTFGPVDPDDVIRSPLDARLSVEQAELSGVAALFGQAPAAQGRLRLTATLKGAPSSGVQIQGELKTEQLRLGDAPKPAPLPLTARFTLDVTAQENSYLVDVASCQWAMGQTQAMMTGQISQIPTKPTLALRITGEAMALEGLMESAQALGLSMPQAISATGQARIELQINGSPAALTLHGHSTIQRFQLRSPQWPQPIQVSELNLVFDPDAITVSPFRATLGERTVVDVTSLSVHNYRRQPQARLQVAVENARVEDLLKTAAALGYGASLSGAGLLTFTAMVETPLADGRVRPTLAGQGQITGGRITHDNLTVTDLAARIKFQGQTVDLTPLTCRLYGGRYSGRVTLTGTEPDITAIGNFNGVDVNQFLSAMSSLKDTLYGQADGTLNMHWRGRHADVLLATLSGHGRLTVTDGRLTAFNLMQQIITLGELVGLSADGKETRFRQFTTNYRLGGGRLLTEELKWDLNQVTVTGRGSLQLASPHQTDYVLRAQLAPSLTPAVVPPGNILSAAGKYILKDQTVVVPLRMSGPLRQPHFHLDGNVLRENLPRMPQKPVEAIQDVLEIFKKRPKQQP